jgi:hypothetical protein
MDNLEKYIVEQKTAFDTELPSLKVWAAIEKRLDTEGGAEAQIEQFITKNRTAFDTEIPNLKVWAGIDKYLNRGTERRAWIVQWAWRAAAAVFLLAVGAAAGIFFNEKREAGVVAKEMENVAPNFKETEKYYDAQVKNRLAKLASFDQQDPSVIADLEQIDAVQQELKQEMELAPSSAREEIVRRMIENYQIKLNILERVLRHFETNEKENDFEKNDKKNERI